MRMSWGMNITNALGYSNNKWNMFTVTNEITLLLEHVLDELILNPILPSFKCNEFFFIFFFICSGWNASGPLEKTANGK